MSNMLTPKELKALYRVHDISEIVVNETIHFGINYYAYKEDILAAEIPSEDYTPGLNELFYHLNSDGMDKLIDFIYARDGYLAADEDVSHLVAALQDEAQSATKK